MPKPRIDLAPFRNRDRFGDFLNQRGLTRQGVEVGVHRGDFADALLSRWKGFLHLIDPWSVPPGYESEAAGLQKVWRTDGNRDRDLEFCRNRLRRWNGRTAFHRLSSRRGAEVFGAEVLHFVYIDGDHRDFMVAEDLRDWYPKLVPGGILAGHDIICPGEVGGGWGGDVQKAVFAFAALHELTVWLVMEEDNSPWSFYMEKPS